MPGRGCLHPNRRGHGALAGFPATQRSTRILFEYAAVGVKTRPEAYQLQNANSKRVALLEEQHAQSSMSAASLTVKQVFSAPGARPGMPGDSNEVSGRAGSACWFHPDVFALDDGADVPQGRGRSEAPMTKAPSQTCWKRWQRRAARTGPQKSELVVHHAAGGPLTKPFRAAKKPVRGYGHVGRLYPHVLIEVRGRLPLVDQKLCLAASRILHAIQRGDYGMIPSRQPKWYVSGTSSLNQNSELVKVIRATIGTHSW